MRCFENNFFEFFSEAIFCTKADRHLIFDLLKEYVSVCYLIIVEQKLNNILVKTDFRIIIVIQPWHRQCERLLYHDFLCLVRYSILYLHLSFHLLKIDSLFRVAVENRPEKLLLPIPTCVDLADVESSAYTQMAFLVQFECFMAILAPCHQA